MRHTAFLARLIGLFTLILAAAIGLRKTEMLATVSQLTQSQPLLLVLGFLSLAVGLAMVLAHNVWRGGLLPVIVTLAGWVFLLRGVVVLCLPHKDVAALLDAAHYETLYYEYVVIGLAIGLYLTVAGFRHTSS
jgi:vacuolar-type H+-ATPase subunit I/STV1